MPQYKNDPAQVKLWKQERQLCRTNLGYFARQYLGYMDIHKPVHGEMIYHLQQFDGGVDTAEEPTLKGCGYQPATPMWELKGPRRRLILIPRGHLKSTICTTAHTIQWLINYPDVRILISTATEAQATKFISEIKQHFQMNNKFRSLFPEFCPSGKNVKEWGTQESFTIPCRTIVRKEPSVSICTIGKVIAGGHYDVIKNDDLVDKENVRTPEQIENVKSHFGFLGPLLETSSIAPHSGWVDIIGTIYDFSDLHHAIWESERDKPEAERRYSILVRSAAPNYPEGPVMWPDRVPLEALKAIESDPALGPAILYPQYLMNPIVGKAGLVESDKELVWVPRKAMDEIYPRLVLHVTVDLAGMDTDAKGRDNDYTAITLHGFTGGVMYVPMIWHGRFTPDEVVDLLFKIAHDHPRVMSFKIEKDAHARVLLPSIRREQAKRNQWLVIDPLQKDNRTSKQQRIKGLQSLFRQKAIRFAADLPCRVHLLNEILRFPKYSHDDILDTLADALQNREGGVVSDMAVAPQEHEGAAPGPATWEEVFGASPDTTVEAVNSVTGW